MYIITTTFQRFQHFLAVQHFLVVLALFSGFSTFQRFWHFLAVLELFSGSSTFQRFQHFFVVLALFSSFSTFQWFQNYFADLEFFCGPWGRGLFDHLPYNQIFCEDDFIYIVFICKVSQRSFLKIFRKKISTLKKYIKKKDFAVSRCVCI